MNYFDNKPTAKRIIYNIIRYQLLDRHYYGFTAKLRPLPDLIIIGAKRCGTTSLYQYLGEHPCISRSMKDNVGFFNNNFELGLDYYRSFFPLKPRNKCKRHITFEVTTSYMQESKTAQRIFKTLPNVKLLIIVRNPVDRAYSEYNLEKNRQSFEESVFEEMKRIDTEDKALSESKIVELFSRERYHLIRKSMYYQQLVPWLQLFPRDQIMILSTEDYDKDTQGTYDKIFDFVGVEKYEIRESEKINKGKYSKMNDKTRQILLDYFRPHNEKFFQLIGKKFEWES